MTAERVADVQGAGGAGREADLLHRANLFGRTTCDIHVRNALAKLDCRMRTQAATRAIELGIVETTPSG